MPENDDVVYHSADRESRQTLDNIHRLVTLERSQKLDLLIHLINNLSQPLVVCGPEGIGKTTLLDVLQAHQQAHWRICRIEGSAQLSFERLSEHLQQQLADVAGESLSDKLGTLDETSQKVVWIVDNAGLLVPGLISSLIQLSRGHDCLRLVLALTHDELHLKNSSDPDISNCHLIEIPPLSRQHYTAFLQNLSAGQGAMISFKAINDGLVENLYKKTHGIPGKIIEELPRLSQYKPVSSLAWGGSALIVLGLLIAGGLMVLNMPETATKKATDISESLYKTQPVDIAVATPVIQAPVEAPYSPESPISDANRADESAKTPDAGTARRAPTEVKQAAVVDEADNGSVVSDVDNETTAIQKPVAENDVSEPVTMPQLQTVALQQTAIPEEPAPRVAQEQQTETPAPPKKTEKPIVQPANKQKPALEVAQKTPEDKPAAVKKVSSKPEPAPTRPTGKDWLKSRNPKHYTLQIMVLSQRDSAEKLIRNYPSQQENMHYFAVQKQGTTKYVVVLGDYPSRSAAKKARKRLPKPLSKAWIRSFRVLQQ